MATFPVASQLWQPGVHILPTAQVPNGTTHITFQPVLSAADYKDPTVSYALKLEQTIDQVEWKDYVTTTFLGAASNPRGPGLFGGDTVATSGVWIRGFLNVTGRAFTLSGTITTT
jgi:hypothetical protein